MATLVDSPEFTADEVYEIQQTDPVEGAATGASFAGIGVSNEPHQQLANRTAYLNQKRVTDESNIAALQAFQALFRGSMGLSGYAKIPFADSQRGTITAIVQWGLIDWGSSQSEGLYGPYSFPIAFPNACFNLMITTLTPEAAGISASGDNVVMVSSSYRPTATSFWVWNNLVGGANGARGFYWFAIGF